MPIARPTPVTVKAEDGTQFKAHLKGDEFLSWYEDTSGNIMTKDEDGVVRYSEFKADHFERGEALNKGSRRRHMGKVRMSERTSREMVEHGRKQRAACGYPSADEIRRRIRRGKSIASEIDQNIPQLKNLSMDVETPNYAPPTAGSLGFPTYIVYVKFADSGSFTQPELTDDEIDALFFGPTMSVAKWWDYATNGAVKVTKLGMKRLTIPGTLTDYGQDQAKTMQFEYDVLDALVASGFDFSPYEGGTVDVNWQDGTTTTEKAILTDKINVVILLHAFDSSTGNSPGVWGHAMMGANGWESPNGFWITGLQTFGTYFGPGEKLGIGLAVHEGAHGRFKLPDLYATDGSSIGLGNWSTMASGPWGALLEVSADGVTGVLRAGKSPTLFDPLSLMLIDPGLVDVITDAGRKDVPSNTGNGAILPSPRGEEFFVVQTRVIPSMAKAAQAGVFADTALLTGWYAAGYVNSPMPTDTCQCTLLYHVDLTKEDNNTTGQFLCDLLEMHGGEQNLSAPTGSSSANSGDPWDPAVTQIPAPAQPSKPLVTFYSTPVNQDSDPALKFNDGSDSELELTDFTTSTPEGDLSLWGYTITKATDNPVEPEIPVNPAPEPPAPEICHICDKPRVYQMKTW